MKKIAIIFLSMIMVLSLAACSSDSSEEMTDAEYVKENGKLIIGYTVYAPMNYTDEEGNLTGFDTEFAEAVCEKLGVEPEFQEISWDTKTVELEAKNIDAIWNGMTITEELLETTAISEPYVKNMQVIITKSDSGIKSTVDLEGKTVAVEAGSAGQAAAEDDTSLAKADIVTVTKQTDALVEVQSGTADAAVLDYTLAKATLGEGTDFEDLIMVEGVELSVEEYGIAFRKGSDLKEEVDEIIKELKEDGTLQELADKYGLNLTE